MEALREKGAKVDEIIVYDTILPRSATREGFMRALNGVDTAIFTSPSGIRHAVELLESNPATLASKRLVAIGPVTAKAMEVYGLTPAAIADEYTDEGIIKALLGEIP